MTKKFIPENQVRTTPLTVKKININADMGEGWGAYDIGNDEALLKLVKSASIACGFHAGDPVTMERLTRLAVENGVSIGAHPGFDDLWGFGRRKIDMKPTDLEYMVAYQIGALQAMANYAGGRVTHLKAHGALNNMAATDGSYAMAIGRAIKTVDPSIIYVVLAGSKMQQAAEQLGLKLAREGFCDRMYEEDGNLTSRKLPNAVHSDPEIARRQVLEIALENKVTTRTGKRIPYQADTLCIHGDEPTALEVATAVCNGLREHGIENLPIDQLELG
jgi:UPF0271 protein